MKFDSSFEGVDHPLKDEQMSNFSEINTIDGESDVSVLVNNEEVYSNTSLLEMYGDTNKDDDLSNKMKIQLDAYSKENVPNCDDSVLQNMQNCTEYGFVIPDPKHYKDYTNWYNKIYKSESIITAKFENQFGDLFENYETANKIPLERKNEIKEFIVKNGSVSKYRYFIWSLFSNDGNEAEFNTLVEKYDNDKETVFLNIPDKDIINNDLLRTFPTNIHFMKSRNFDKNAMIDSLEKHLSLFSLMHRDDVGYCQSLNYICGMVLLVSPSNLDASGFNRNRILDSIVTSIGLSLYDNSLSGLKSFQETLLILIFEFIPDLFDILFEDIEYGLFVLDCILDKYEAKEPDKYQQENNIEMPVLMIYLSKWVLNCFINILPFEDCLKIIDLILISKNDGIEWINKIALTLLDLGMEKFKNYKSYKSGKPMNTNVNFESKLKQSLSFKLNKVLNKDNGDSNNGSSSLPSNSPRRALTRKQSSNRKKKIKTFSLQCTNPLEMEFMNLLTNTYQPELYTALDFDSVIMKKLKNSKYHEYDMNVIVNAMLKERMSRRDKIRNRLRIKKKE